MFSGVCLQISSLVRVCYANLTIQFESLLCFASRRLFTRHLLVRNRITGIAVAYISRDTATEHEISISQEYKKYATRTFGMRLI